MSVLEDGFAESMSEGGITDPTDWKAFQLGALYASLFIAEAIHDAPDQSDRGRLIAALSALECIDIETDLPCECPVEVIG